MRAAGLLFTLFAAFANSGVDAFVTPSQSSSSCISRSSVSSALPKSSSLHMSALDGIKEPVQSYVDIWTPMFKQASESGLLPDFILHWGHGAAMASVLLSMGVIGAYMGWQIRFGNGDEVTPLTLGADMGSSAEEAVTAPANVQQIGKDGARDQRGFWLSDGGQCRIFNDKITNRLSYEELIGDGSERLHGFFDTVDGESNSGYTWQATLVIIEEGEDPWYGPSCGEKPESVGSIRLKLIAAGEGSLGSEIIETQIRTDEDGDWQTTVCWKRAPDEEPNAAGIPVPEDEE